MTRAPEACDAHILKKGNVKWKLVLSAKTDASTGKQYQVSKVHLISMLTQMKVCCDYVVIFTQKHTHL